MRRLAIHEVTPMIFQKESDPYFVEYSFADPDVNLADFMVMRRIPVVKRTYDVYREALLGKGLIPIIKDDTEIWI
jgi:hypothetical protein